MVSCKCFLQLPVQHFPRVCGTQGHRHPIFKHNIRMKTKPPILKRAKLKIVQCELSEEGLPNTNLVCQWQQVLAFLAEAVKTSSAPSAI